MAHHLRFIGGPHDAAREDLEGTPCPALWVYPCRGRDCLVCKADPTARRDGQRHMFGIPIPELGDEARYLHDGADENSVQRYVFGGHGDHAAGLAARQLVPAGDPEPVGLHRPGLWDHSPFSYRDPQITVAGQHVRCRCVLIFPRDA